MTQSWMSWGCKLGSASFLALGGAIATFCNFARAQITPDGTLGAESSAVTPLVNINGLPSERLDGGAIRGTNLFHSFREFNIDEGRGAYFTNPDGIANILSRVTGNDPTDVLGTLGVLGNANLFLINPNGIIFGPNASLDVGGSFLGSTASSLNFADGKQFSTTAPQTTPLLSVSVPIGLQFGETGGSILNQSQVTNTSGRQVGLQVQPGKTLALVGGDVALEGGGLQAEGGRISLGSVAGIGLVGLNPTDNGWALKYEGVQNQDIQLSQQAVVDVSGEGGGDIQIQGGRVALTEGSKIVANTLGSQSGGEINIQASQLQIQDGAFVSASTFGSGGAGNLSVAADTVELIGPGGREFLERLLNGTFSQSDIRNGLFTVSFGPGAAGSLTITTGNLIVKDGAEVSTSTYTQGAGGSITVRASDSVQVSGSLLFAGTQSAGNGGDLNIDTKKLILQDFATVTTDPFAQGQGGDLTVNASDYVEVVGAPTDDPFFVTGIFSNSLPLLEDIDSGDSGDVTINTGRLIVRDGGEIGAGTFGNGKGGNLIINASESVEVLGVTPDQLRLPSNVYADTFGTGNIGKLTVSTRRLTIRDGGQISAATFAQGQGGNLIVNATESVEVTGSSPIGIDQSSNEIFYVVDGQFPSGLISSSVAAGDAGNLTITTGQLVVRNGGHVSANSQGAGNAGNITINVQGTLQANNGLISTAAAQASGGAIDITAADIRLFGNSDITTNVLGGGGGGGNITLKADSILALDDSDILAFSVDGSGGNITLNTPVFFGLRDRPTTSGTVPATLDNNNRVDVNASGRLAAGIITLPDVSFLQNTLTQLPENLIDTNTLIANSCIARSSQQQGSFTITGAGALPSRPGDAATSPYPTGTVRTVPRDTASSNSPSSILGIDSARPWQLGDPIMEPDGVYNLADGQLVLSRECP